MKRLNILAPPMFERAIGYEGNCRFIGLYWSRAADTVICEDGIEIIVGGHVPAWNTITTHRLMLSYSSTYQLGSEYMDARHWLLLDRAERRFYLAKPSDAKQKLLEQHALTGKRPVMDLDEVLMSLEEASERLKATPTPDDIEYREWKETERRNATYEMHRWLEDSCNPVSTRFLRLVRLPKAR